MVVRLDEALMRDRAREGEGWYEGGASGLARGALSSTFIVSMHAAAVTEAKAKEVLPSVVACQA